MSFGTSFVHETYFSRETFDNFYKVEDAIREEKELINSLEKELLGYALMTEPDKMLKIDPDVNPMDYITSRVKQLLEDYSSSSVRLSELYDLKNDWNDCHTKNDKGDEVAKYPKEDSYPCLFGDFIKSDNDDEEN